MFKHYILTRMNLGIYKRADAVKWMRKRMKMFDEYLFKSIMYQTCQNFKLILCFDERTPDRYLTRYDYCDKVEVCYCQPKEHVPGMVIEAPWLITSRIDSDDYYFPEFVEEIQSHFEPYPHVLGIDYYQVKGDLVYTSGRIPPNSPFLSLIEPWESPISAYGHEHTVMPDFFDAIKIDKPLAVQMIHDCNIINNIRGTLIETRAKDLPGGLHS